MSQPLMRHPKTLAILALVALPSIALAFVPGESGTHPEFWERHAVVVGKVAGIVPPNAETKTMMLRFDVSTVLATDITVDTALVAYAGPAVADSPLPEVHVGDTFIACIKRTRAGGWECPTAVVQFLESESSVRRISGNDDAAIAEVAQRVRLAREQAWLERSRRPLQKGGIK
jgi:hypothetical protein